MWTKAEEQKLIRLANSGKYFYTEIAEKMDTKVGNVRHHARRLKLASCPCPERRGKWNSKHAHLRLPVFKYFLTHTWEETMVKFDLTERELKSIFTVGYRMPELKHLRKETRRRDAWSAKEYKFLLQHSGLRSRDWIAKKLNRGGELGIKDRLDLLKVSSKSMNGITISQFREAFGKEPEFYLKSKAGPRRSLHGDSRNSYYKIIPWVWLNQQIKTKKLKAHKIFVKLVAAQAMFQEWYFEGDALEKMKLIVRHKGLV